MASFETQDPVPCLLSNEAWKTSKTYDVLDPHDPKKLLHKAYCVSKEEALQAVEVAAKAFKSWSQSGISTRQEIFRKAAALLKERSSEYAAVEVAETTSASGWANFEAGLATEGLSETANAANYLRGETFNTAGQRALIERYPYGVVLGCSPWNAPLTLGLRAVTNALMAGNTVILKTSEYSPKTQAIIGSLFVEAGLPAGVLSIINIAPQDAPEVVEAIIAHKAVRKVNFTGSTVVGTKIAQTCAKYLKPVTLELGGKAPLIALADADLAVTANAALFGSFFHSGQICMATNTVIAHESIVKDLEAAILKKHSEMTAAPDSGYVRGLFNPASAKRIRDVVKDAKDKGATVHAGKGEEDHNIIQPKVITGVTPEMRIYAEENFAPIMAICPFKTEEEAIEIANSSDYGLAAAVFSQNEGHAQRVARQLESGMVHINGATVHDRQELPHGGWKSSGWGRFNGIEGLREFTQIKVITINEPHGQYPV